MQEPFGQVRQDHVMAALIQAVFNSYHSEHVTFEQAFSFLPTYDRKPAVTPEEQQEQSVAADLARIEAWKASSYVVDRRGEDN